MLLPSTSEPILSIVFRHWSDWSAAKQQASAVLNQAYRGETSMKHGASSICNKCAFNLATNVFHVLLSHTLAVISTAFTARSSAAACSVSAAVAESPACV